MKKICVTGANGFIGRHLCRALSISGKSIKAYLRHLDKDVSFSLFQQIQVKEIGSIPSWKDEFQGYDCVVHCAGMTNSLNYRDNNLKSYLSINSEYTKHLAKEAAAAGVKRFIFLSSIKVNGETTGDGENCQKFFYTDSANPKDYYAISKFEAEKALWKIARETNLEVIVVRLPLVYGKGVQGNLERLKKLINLNVPLPFGGINNKRSIIGIDNTVDFLTKCIEHPDAAGKTFLVSDAKDISTSSLIKLMGLYMNKSVKLYKLPIFLLKVSALIFGKKKEIERLLGSLQVNSEYTKKILNWTPPISVEEGIRRMVQGK